MQKISKYVEATSKFLAPEAKHETSSRTHKYPAPTYKNTRDMWTSNGGDDDDDDDTTGDGGGENGGDDGDGDGNGGGRSGDGGEHDHNDVLICLLGQQNSVMSGQGRPVQC